MIIDGVYVSTVRRNEYNGYTVFKFKYFGPAKDRIVIYVQAIIPIYVRDMPLRIEGDFIEGKKVPTFKANSVCEKISNVDISVAYLSNKEFCGIGPKRARTIVDALGPDIFSIINDEEKIKKLKEIKGLPSNVADELVLKIRNTIAQREVFEFMLKYYGTVIPAMKIADKYKYKALQKLKENPYICCMEFEVPFYTADAIARDLGFNYLDRKRIEAIIFEAMNMSITNGNTFVYQDELNKNILFVVKNSAFRNKIPLTFFTSVLVKCKWLKIDKDEDGRTRVFKRDLWLCEYEVARHITRLRAEHAVLKYDEKIIEKVEEKFNIKYHSAQKNAFNLLKKTGLKILTGGPGTGKTTLLNGLIEAYKTLNKSESIVLCSPTGRAAQRMKEQTGHESSTIHKLLEIKPFEDTFTSRDNINPIEAKFIIVDEFSMIDIEIMSIFLNAIKGNTLVLFVGDVDQLPSVGPGNVMRDLIKSDVIETYQLTNIYRQSSGSVIIDNANKIIKGDVSLKCNDNFEIIELDNNNDFNTAVEKIFDDNKTFNPSNTQILTTVKHNDGGTFQLNNLIHRKFYHGKEFHYNFSIGDKVIITKNDYELGVFNGDMGYVKHILENGIEIEFGTDLTFIPYMSLDIVSLAYAITIHKSQGSEFENIIIALPDTASNMLQRNLLYTAITRAKNKIIILSKNSSVEKSILQNSIIQRNTALLERIKDK